MKKNPDHKKIGSEETSGVRTGKSIDHNKLITMECFGVEWKEEKCEQRVRQR